MATTQQFYLIPAEGKRVRDPLNGQVLPTEGAFKPRTAYWFRRLRDKDVAEGTPPAVTVAAPAAATSPEAQQLADAEAAIKTAEAALETAAATGTKAAGQTTNSNKGAAK